MICYKGPQILTQLSHKSVKNNTLRALIRRNFHKQLSKSVPSGGLRMNIFALAATKQQQLAGLDKTAAIRRGGGSLRLIMAKLGQILQSQIKSMTTQATHLSAWGLLALTVLWKFIKK